MVRGLFARCKVGITTLSPGDVCSGMIASCGSRQSEEHSQQRVAGGDSTLGYRSGRSPSGRRTRMECCVAVPPHPTASGSLPVPPVHADRDPRTPAPGWQSTSRRQASVYPTCQSNPLGAVLPPLVAVARGASSIHTRLPSHCLVDLVSSRHVQRRVPNGAANDTPAARASAIRVQGNPHTAERIRAEIRPLPRPHERPGEGPDDPAKNSNDQEPIVGEKSRQEAQHEAEARPGRRYSRALDRLTPNTGTPSLKHRGDSGAWALASPAPSGPNGRGGDQEDAGHVSGSGNRRRWTRSRRSISARACRYQSAWFVIELLLDAPPVFGSATPGTDLRGQQEAHLLGRKIAQRGMGILCPGHDPYLLSGSAVGIRRIHGK